MRGAIICVAFAGLLGQPGAAPDELTQIRAYVTAYYAKARAIIVRERVRLQPLAPDFRPTAGGRELVYELRLEWDPESAGAPDARVVRTLLQIDGRTAKSGDEPGCFDPDPVSFEPLSSLLPSRQQEFVFQRAGAAAIDRRRVVLIDYRPAVADEPFVRWKGECGQIDLRGRLRGRIWADPSSGEVLRLEQWLHGGPFQFAFPIDRIRPGGYQIWQTLERAHTSTRYARVRFTNPDETMLLPSSIQTLNVIRHGGVERMFITQTYGDYRRFVTGGRVVK